MPTISPTAIAAFSSLFKQNPNFQAWLNVFSQSPTLVNELNSFAAGGADHHIDLGLPGGGSDSGGTLITIDPNDLPTDNSATSLGKFASLLGHELGHAVENGGLPNFSGLTNYAAAVHNGDNAEGVALRVEYTVASELGNALGVPVAMHSGSQVQSLIAQSTQRDTPGSSQFAADAQAAGTRWTATQFVSTTVGVVAPTAANPDGYATYNQYYAIQFLVQHAGGNPQNINWRSNVSITDNPDGSWSFNVNNVTTPQGTVGIFGLYRAGASGEAMLDGSVIDPSSGGKISEVIGTVAGNGTPEGATNITFGSGSTPQATITVTDAVGRSQTYTIAGTPTVQDAIDGSVTASGTGTTILVGGDNATLTGGSGRNLLIELGNNETATGGSGTSQIVVGGSNDSVTASGATIATLTNASFNLSGSNDTINLGANSYAGLLGGTGIVVNNDLAGDTVNLTSGAAATINGSGGYLGICGTNVTVAASNESIGTISGASFNLSGSNDTINLGANSYAGLLGGSGIVVNNDVAGDTVNLTSNASATINGSGGYVGICGTNVWVNASNDSIATITGASFNLSGGNDGITLGANSYLGLLGGSGYMVWGSGDSIATWANTSLNVQGSNDTVSLGGTGDYLGLLGGSGYTVYGSGDTIATLANTSLNLQGGNDGVYLGGTGDYLGLLGGAGYMVYGSGDTINTWANTSLNLQGSNDAVGLGGSGDYLGLLGGSGYTVWGSGDTIATWANTNFTVSGNGDSIAEGDNSSLTVWGDSDTIGIGRNSVDTVLGAGDTSWFNGSAVGSQGSGVDETITTNADGSWVDHLLDTGNRFGWTEEQFVHAANNQLSEETVNFDDGWHEVFYWDVYNQNAWSEQELIYDPKGHIANPFDDSSPNSETGWRPVMSSDTTWNDDGTIVEISPGVHGGLNGTLPDGNSDYVQIYANGNWSGANYVISSNDWNPGYGSFGDLNNFLNGGDWTGSSRGNAVFGDAAIDQLAGYTYQAFDPYSFADDGLSTFELDPFGWFDFDLLVDPLVLNLAGGKVMTTARGENGVAFDMRGDGTQQATGWITPDEGFLVVDKEHTGRISSSHDMVSDLNELASFDDNHDGAITAADGRFGDLRVWVPDDKGGRGRLDTLAQLGIAGIDLKSAAVAGQADHGNRINSTFRFTYADGTSGEGADVSFLTGTDALLQAMASFAPAAPVPANMPPAPPAPEYALAAAH